MYDSPLQKLINTPESFEFFQAVRVLEQFLYQKYQQITSVGHDYNLSREYIRFKSQASLKFPTSEISRSNVVQSKSIQELEVNFFGLFGPSALLPYHYTEIILERLQIKDTSLRDFLDLFNHRMIALFYRCFEKYHLPAQYDHARRTNKKDSFTKMLSALIGQHHHASENAFIKEESLLYYVDYFAKFPRSAVNLSLLLSDYFNIPIEIEQFYGQWISIEESLRTSLKSVDDRLPGYNILGKDTVIGNRTWDVQSSFVIKLGPLSYDTFQQYLPFNQNFNVLTQIARQYVGQHYNFVLNLMLEADEVPMCCLGKNSYLSWNIWLLNAPETKVRDDTLLTIDNRNRAHVPH